MTQRSTSRAPFEVAPTTPVRDIMHRSVCLLDGEATVVDAAGAMRDRDIGDVLVRCRDGSIGIVTDRDLVVRAVANGQEPSSTAVEEVCSRNVAALHPDGTVADAVRLLRELAIRRVPVVENGEPVGIVSIGDLAMNREPGSALADISAAPPQP